MLNETLNAINDLRRWQNGEAAKIANPVERMKRNATAVLLANCAAELQALCAARDSRN